MFLLIKQSLQNNNKAQASINTEISPILCQFFNTCFNGLGQCHVQKTITQTVHFIENQGRRTWNWIDSFVAVKINIALFR